MEARPASKDTAGQPLCPCGNNALIELITGHQEYVVVHARLCGTCGSMLAGDMVRVIATEGQTITIKKGVAD